MVVCADYLSCTLQIRVESASAAQPSGLSPNYADYTGIYLTLVSALRREIGVEIHGLIPNEYYTM